MSNHFKPSEFQVKTESSSTRFQPNQDEVAIPAGTPAPGPGAPRVMKVESHAAPTVRAFEFDNIKRGAQGNYQKTKAKYGALATTDGDRSARLRKDSRFSLSSLVRDPLAVEQEERRALDEQVSVRVAAIAEEARAQAAQQGYREGLKKGYEESFGQFQAEGASRLGHLEALLGEMDAAKTEIYRFNEKFLIELIFRVAKMVMLRELATDKDYLVRLTRDLIERIGVKESIRIRIHPDDVTTIAMLKEGMEQAFGSLKNLTIEPSKQVRLGGCTLETELGAIDATLETQLEGVYEALTGREAGGAADGEAAR